MMAKGIVVTFYSYKGGVGRSFALANVAALLSKWGSKVLCVDWDLESPGLAQYFRKYMARGGDKADRSTTDVGVLEYVQSIAVGKVQDWRQYVSTFKLPECKSQISLMVAGDQNVSYIERLQALRWDELYEKHRLGNFLEEMRTEWKEDYDFVLVDSRTGVTDIGGITTIQFPDILAFFFTANYQSLDGAIDVARRVLKEHEHLPYDRGGLITLPVLSRFDMREEYKLSKEWLGIAERKLNEFYKDWLHKEVSVADMINVTKVPYMSYWSFGERLSVVEDASRDSDSINYSLETLAALIARECAQTQKLVENRDSFVGSASNEDVPLKKRRSEEKVKLKENCERILRKGNILEWRELVSQVWSGIPERLIEWKPTAEQVWDKESEKQEAARFEAVEICLPSFVPILVAVESGREELWREAVGALRQLMLLRDRMGGGFTDVVEIGSHMLYIAGSLGMAIAARTKQLDFVNNWMRLLMPARRYGQDTEKPWAEIKCAHYRWGKYLPCAPDPFKDLWQVCQSDYVSVFFKKKKLLEMHLFLANLAQSLYELGRYTKDRKRLEALKVGDIQSFHPSELKVWPVWVLMKPDDFKAATWDLFGTSAGVFEFVSPAEGITLDDFWVLWKRWKSICVKPMESHAWRRGGPFPQSEWLMLPGEPHG